MLTCPHSNRGAQSSFFAGDSSIASAGVLSTLTNDNNNSNNSIGSNIHSNNLSMFQPRSLPANSEAAAVPSGAQSASLNLMRQQELLAQATAEMDIEDYDEDGSLFAPETAPTKVDPKKSWWNSNNEKQLERFTKQLQKKLEDGHGETLFELGFEDDGTSMNLTEEEFTQALRVVEGVADKLKSHVSIIRKRVSGSSSSVAEDLSAGGEKSRSAGKQQQQQQQRQHQTETTVAAEDNAATAAAATTAHATEENEIVSLALAGSHSSTAASAAPSLAPLTGHSADLLIRRFNLSSEDVSLIPEIRVAVVGNVDAGKSTLLGVLTRGSLDDGRGKARTNLFRHKHEIETGRTSSVGQEIMGFGSKGENINMENSQHHKLSWDEICAHASKIVTFIDLAGHERYLKTTVFGITGCSPDFVMLIIGSNMGIVGMTKEHLGLALAMNVPVFVVVTKIDMCPPNVLEETIKQLTKILKSSGCRKVPLFINGTDDLLLAVHNFVSARICPIFQISSVTGTGLDHLRQFFNIIPSYQKYDADKTVEFWITDIFTVPGVGTVVSGTMIDGTVHLNDTLYLGPDSNGHFVQVPIKSIQRKRVNVQWVTAGQSASFSLKKVKRSTLRKGMVLLSRLTGSPAPRAYTYFKAEIVVLYHSTTIAKNYQAMVHVGTVRQTARIVQIDGKDVLRTGDRGVVTFEFLQRPEFMVPGRRILFREGRAKGLGKVVACLDSFTRPQSAPSSSLSSLSAGAATATATGAAASAANNANVAAIAAGALDASSAIASSVPNSTAAAAAATTAAISPVSSLPGSNALSASILTATGGAPAATTATAATSQQPNRWNKYRGGGGGGAAGGANKEKKPA